MSKGGIEIKFKTNKNALSNAINNAVSNSSFNLTCPNCGAHLKITGQDFGTTIKCGFCYSSISVNNENFNKQIKDLQKSFDKMFK